MIFKYHQLLSQRTTNAISLVVHSSSGLHLSRRPHGIIIHSIPVQSRRSHSSNQLGYHSKSLIYALWVLSGMSIVSSGWATYEYRQRNPYRSETTNNSTLSSSQGSSVAHLKNQSKPTWNLSDENLAGARADLLELLGPEGINDDLGTRIAHSSTEWSEAPHGANDRPSLIVYPKTTGNVSEIAKICHRRRIPMIAFSGGTSLEGTLAALNQEICIDFQKMNRVIEVHEQDMDVTVQPGVGYQQLNEMLVEKNLFFPPDPGPGAQIGGMVSQNCSGTNAYRYGTMKDWVLGLTVVLADGTVIKTRGRPRKSSAGYDLTRLFVGSEGTLGIITEASLKLTARPDNIRVAVAVFPDIQSAIQTSIKIVQGGHMLAAMELLDDVTMRAVNQSEWSEQKWPEKTTLFFKFSGTPSIVSEQIEETKRIAKEQDCSMFTFSDSDEEAQSLWEARKTALWSMLAMKEHPSDSFLSADVCVPISSLGDIISATKKNLDGSGLVGSCLGHVGDGNFHTTVLFSEKNKEKARDIIIETQKLGIKLDGTVTGEHGIGLVNRDALIWEVGENSVAAMRQIKGALDPLWLLNPGKMFKLWEDQE